MPRYVARFFKKTLSDNGHEYRSLQRSFDVNARTRAEAEELAKRRLCELEHIKSWADHSDECVVEEADFPS
jgi:hypothetical protein